MPRYQLTIAYDGTDFCGWQKQEPKEHEEGATTHPAFALKTPRIESTREGRVALRTVQGVVESAVREVVREPVQLLGASRTDSGVHARGQVAAFSCEPREPQPPDTTTPGIPPPRGIGWPIERGADRLMAAINSRLPDDVLITAAQQVHVGFDPIGDAIKKEYTYTFHVGLERPLFDRRTVHHVRHGRLAIAPMQAAAAMLIGEHDFAAFAAAGHGRLTTVRTVYSCAVEDVSQAMGTEGRSVVRLRIVGNGFLWNMVRIIAGTLLEVGLQKRAPDCVAEAIATGDRRLLGPTLPPTGLCLEWVEYPARGA